MELIDPRSWHNVDCAVVIVAAPYREEQRYQRGFRPIQQAGRNAVVLRKRQPFPLDGGARRQEGQGLALELIKQIPLELRAVDHPAPPPSNGRDQLMAHRPYPAK